MTTYTLADLKQLTLDQYDACKERALERTHKRIGERPTRRQFERELGRLWTMLDLIALVVFACALVVSSAHIIIHMGKLASASFDATGAAAFMDKSVFVAIHQWALIPLAEGSLILFTVMFSVTHHTWRRWLYLLLAAVAVMFVLVANLQSGIGLLESILAPAFTIGIGLKLEMLIVQSLKRRREVDAKYLEAMNIYEAATQDATAHPAYKRHLMQEIWQKLMSLKANQVFADAPPGFKRLAVEREMKRDQWMDDASELVDVVEVDALPKEVKADNPQVPFGSLVPEMGDRASMPTTLNGSAPIVSANGHGKN